MKLLHLLTSFILTSLSSSMTIPPPSPCMPFNTNPSSSMTIPSPPPSSIPPNTNASLSPPPNKPPNTNTSSSMSILLPLYKYPDNDASGWSTLLSSIAAFPSVHWEIIVNPNTGPGPDPYPDSNYIIALTKLNSYPNVFTIGYVEIHDTNEPLPSVQKQINQYANWATYSGARIGVNGIFFDDTSNVHEQANYDYMSTVSGYVKAAFPSPNSRVVCNPGSIAPVELFASCNTIVESELPLSKFDENTVLTAIQPEHAAASAIMINTTPAGTDIAGLIGTMKGKGIGEVYFGIDCCYNVFDTGIMAAMAQAL